MPNNRSKELVEFLQLLSDDSGCDFSDLTTLGHSGENSLHAAIWSEHIELADELVRLGIDLNLPGGLGNTPVHVAASKGLVDLLKTMVEHGADLFALNESRYTPVMSAALSDQSQAVDFLRSTMKRSAELQRFTDELDLANNEIALRAAICEEQTDLVKELVFLGADRFQRDDEQRLPIHLAAAVGNLELVQFLVSINCFTYCATYDMSPTEHAEALGHTEVGDYLREVSRRIQKEKLRRVMLKFRKTDAR